MSFKPLSREFLLNRGYCCNNGCKNCPYKENKMELKTVMRTNEGAKQGLIDLCNTIKQKFGDVKTFVEVGSFMGESAVIFAEQFPNATIYCIDPWLSGYDQKDSASSFDFKDVENQFDLRTKSFNNIVKIKDFSTNVDIKCDVVYIDGLHTYQGVKADILHWMPKVSSVICGHDYYEDEAFLLQHPHIAGVKKAVDELLGVPDKLFIEGSWLKWKI